jgi:hypothetical protein
MNLILSMKNFVKSLTFLVISTSSLFGQDRTENKKISFIVDLNGGYGIGKGVNTMGQFGVGTHLVFKNNFALGFQAEFGFLGGLKKPNGISTYKSQSIVIGKISPLGQNWSLYPYVGIGNYNSVETNNVPDSLLNGVTGLVGSNTVRYTPISITDICIPFGVKFYRTKKKFAGFYAGVNGFYSLNGSFGFFGNVGFAFGGRKRFSYGTPIKIKPDIALYSGPSLTGNGMGFGLNHGIDINLFFKENLFLGLGYEKITKLNKNKELSIYNNVIDGNSASIKLGFKSKVSDKMNVLLSFGYNLQFLNKTTYLRDTSDSNLYSTENIKSNGFVFETMFRRQLSDSPISIMFGPKFSISKEPTYSLKLGISYTMK